MVGKSVLTVKVKASLLRTALPKLLGDGNRRGKVKGFTIQGMRQRQHFWKHTKKDKNKPLASFVQGLLAWGGVRTLTNSSSHRDGYRIEHLLRRTAGDI
jgi:hypothetical protein